MANVRQIAKRAGVSISTVSRVLNNNPRVSEDVRRRVLSVANESGYVPSVGRKSTTNIAFAYTGESSLGSPYDASLMYGMSVGMEEFGYDLMILDVRRARLPHESYTQMFLRKGVRGVVLRTTAETRHVCEAIAEEGFPAVVVGDRFDNPQVNFIDTESRASSREAVEHLIVLGHRRIAMVVNIIDDSDHLDRVQGYRDALLGNGIDFDDRLVLRTPAHRNGGVQAMRRMMTMMDPPTAAYLADPMAAVGAISEAQKMGVAVPRDFSIVGFDDGEARFGVTPELSAVCQDASSVGREAFAVLYRMLEQQQGDAAGTDNPSHDGNDEAYDGNGSPSGNGSDNGSADGNGNGHHGDGAAAVTADAPRVRKMLQSWFEIHGSTGPAPAPRT